MGVRAGARRWAGSDLSVFQKDGKTRRWGSVIFSFGHLASTAGRGAGGGFYGAHLIW